MFASLEEECPQCTGMPFWFVEGQTGLYHLPSQSSVEVPALRVCGVERAHMATPCTKAQHLPSGNPSGVNAEQGSVRLLVKQMSAVEAGCMGITGVDESLELFVLVLPPFFTELPLLCKKLLKCRFREGTVHGFLFLHCHPFLDLKPCVHELAIKLLDLGPKGEVVAHALSLLTHVLCKGVVDIII
ncbi:hypothetical protein KC356_g113 [Hortaea werneckii]|nr:hypothetical protein KC356_g113 [Hortaea werneckii]